MKLIEICKNVIQMWRVEKSRKSPSVKKLFVEKSIQKFHLYFSKRKVSLIQKIRKFISFVEIINLICF